MNRYSMPLRFCEVRFVVVTPLLILSINLDCNDHFLFVFSCIYCFEYANMIKSMLQSMNELSSANKYLPNEWLWMICTNSCLPLLVQFQMLESSKSGKIIIRFFVSFYFNCLQYFQFFQTQKFKHSVYANVQWNFSIKSPLISQQVAVNDQWWMILFDLYFHQKFPITYIDWLIDFKIMWFIHNKNLILLKIIEPISNRNNICTNTYCVYTSVCC